jgi:uncharacterized SAM-binding protein YcdF (DUF218 family)
MFTLSRLTTFTLEPLFWLMLWLAFALTLLSIPRWRTGAVRALWAGFLLLILLGFEVFPSLLLRALERQYPIPTSEQVARHKGVIILGGVIHAELYTAHGQFALNEAAERLTEPMALARQHPHLKLLYSSGEAAMVKAFFEQQGVDMKRVLMEPHARNTRENARLSVAMLGPEACQGDWLVLTSAWHMPRSMAEFDGLGCRVTPYPVDHRVGQKLDLFAYSFGGRSLVLWQVALHEYLGLLVYKLTR